MSDYYQFNKRADFSAVVEQGKIIASSIGPSGEAILLLVDPEHENAPFGRDDQKGFASFPLSKAKQYYDATVIRHDGCRVIQQTKLAQLDISFPFVQPLLDGEVLLAGSRCRYRDGNPERNAVVFSNEAKLLRQFVLGDGINDVQSTRAGKIWVSYFDEGVFGNFGWNKPMGTSGLICFDAAGRIEWEFRPPKGFDAICDCYALNVTENAIWVYYYTEFPLIKVDSDKGVRGWRNEFGGANTLAVDGRRALLWGGYGKDRTRCVLQKIADETLTSARELRIGLPHGIDIVEAKIIGRGSTLHAFAGNSWFTFDLNLIA